MSGPSARTRLGQSTGGEPGTMHKRQRAGIKHIQRGTTHRACGEGCWVSSGARLGLQERRGIRTYLGPLWRGSRRSGYQRPHLPSQAGDHGWLGPWLCRCWLDSLFLQGSLARDLQRLQSLNQPIFQNPRFFFRKDRIRGPNTEQRLKMVCRKPFF